MEKTTENQNQQTQSRVVADNTTQRKEGSDTALDFVDNRPETAMQLRVAKMMNNSPYHAEQNRVVDMIRGASSPISQREAQRVEGGNNKSSLSPFTPFTTGKATRLIQRIRYNSVIYQPDREAGQKLAQLDRNVAIASHNARIGVTNAGGMHTPTQAKYIKYKDAKWWGACVEEQLNLKAKRLGWTTQWRIPGARPDYMMELNHGKRVIADLTTIAETGTGGNHVTEKLNKGSNVMGLETWYAADLIHDGIGPSHVSDFPNIEHNGRVTKGEQVALSHYNAWVKNPDSDYDPDKDAVRMAYGGKEVSTRKFSCTWSDLERINFRNAVNDAWHIRGY